jgi:hypothetical protein
MDLAPSKPDDESGQHSSLWDVSKATTFYRSVAFVLLVD